MANKILMPALSPTMTEGALTKWFVKVGDRVKAGDILAEIETDKATMEVEAVDEGKITKLLVEEGASSVPVNSTIAYLDGPDEIINKDENNRNIENNKKDNIKNKNKNENKNINKNESIEFINKTNDKERNSKNNSIDYIASPYAKKIAKEKNIDLTNIKSSGPGGRIIKRDLENLILKKQVNNVGENPSTMRKIIAERTTLTKQTIPHFYLNIESNVDKLLEMRKKINNDSGVKISINDILVKALALAQKMNPETNVSWVDGKIIRYKSIDVSIAVALDEGLLTPIIKNANSKGLFEISKEIKYLAEKAKKGKLTPEDYNGGTISISNLGMFGITDFAAIINPPQSSILAVGAIKKYPTVVNDEVRIVNILKSTLSADHRVLDGAIAGKLLKDFHDIIENPFNLWLMSDDMEIL
jgi:pyruvate dehydrogenase E2 component (dihydrolipoamide acetyltransferase)